MQPAAGTHSPTPPQVYEPRIWSVRIWTNETGIGGHGFLFKAPYGQAMNAATVLSRACSTRQITRFMFGPASATQTRKMDRAKLERFEDAFERAGLALGIHWEA